MKDNEKTKEQLVKELTELRSQNAAQEKTRKELAVIKIAADEVSVFAENIINTVREPLIALDQDLRVVKVSRSFYEFFKVNPEETVGQLIYDLGNKQWDIPKLRELLETILPEKATFDNYEVEHDFSGVGRRTMLLNARQIQRASGKERIILLAIEDITEHKRLEDLLKEAEGRYRHVFNTANDGIVLFEKREGKITHANQAIEKMLGYSLEECVGNKLQDIGIVDIDNFPTLMKVLDEIGITNYTDVPIKTKSGRHIDTDIYLANRAKLVQCNIRDISQRKQVGEALRESEENYRSLFQNASMGIFHSLPEGKFVRVNPSLAQMMGYVSPEEMISAITNISTQIYVDSKKRSNLLAETVESAGWVYSENRYRRKDGTIMTANLAVRKVLNPDSTVAYLEGFIEDITDRKQAEEVAQNEKIKLDSIIASMTSGLTIRDHDYQLIYQSPVTLGIFGNHIGEKCYQVFQHRETICENCPVELAFQDGKSHTHIVELKLPNGEISYMENIANPIRDASGAIVSCLEINTDITERKKAEEVLRKSEERLRDIIFSIADWVWETDENGVYTYSSQKGFDLFGKSPGDVIGKTPFDFMPPDEVKRVAALFSEIVANKVPIKDLENWNIRRNGERICLLTNGMPILDKEGNLKGYRGVDKDITDRKRAEESLKKTLESLRRAINTTIQVMVSAVEVRDPYTAGHQIRSADLARAVATEMGLPQEQIEGIRMAGSIHDIGKLSIPAEILSKPTKLSAIELLMIKEHARKGYEILKDVESPWPLAEIVHQHHERMDGSGYPRNLKGEEICIEARILSVADVVEAMASHRPYRAGLGIDAALNEIEQNRGIYYDSTVADACLRLFREKDYKLEGT
jgi:PAS domain S-box-containing protein